MRLPKIIIIVISMLYLGCQSFPKKGEKYKSIFIIRTLDLAEVYLKNPATKEIGICHIKRGSDNLCFDVPKGKYEFVGGRMVNQTPSARIITDIFFDNKTIGQIPVEINSDFLILGDFDFSYSGDWDKADETQRTNFKILFPKNEIPSSALGQAFSLQNMTSGNTFLKKLGTLKKNDLSEGAKDKILNENREELSKGGWL